MEFKNPQIPEGINTSSEHPLKEFALLAGGVIICVSLFIMFLAWFAGYLGHWIPFKYEHQIAQHFEQAVPEPSKTRDYLQGIAERMAQAQQLPHDMSITVHYIEDDAINAFATLGGHIIIMDGLLKKMPNENALAMVIGHEVAHIKHRHPITALGRGVTMAIALAAITGVSGNSAAETIVGKTGLLTSLSFTRDQETQADKTALAALVQVYGHAAGAADVFKLLATESEQHQSIPQFLSTHPNPQRRIELIERRVQEFGWGELETDTIPIPVRSTHPEN